MMVVADDPEGKGCAYASKEGGGCQFTLAAHELVAFDGKHWCPFHLPMTQKTSWEEAKVETFNRAIFDFIEDASQKYRIADFTGVVFPPCMRFYRTRLSDVLRAEACAERQPATLSGGRPVLAWPWHTPSSVAS